MTLRSFGGKSDVVSTQTQRGEAWKVTYGPKWKCGDHPAKVLLGELSFPVDVHIELMNHELRRAFPQATDSRLFNEHGHWICAGCL